MTHLKRLHLGSGHGGWLSSSFCNRFYGPAMESLTHLVKLNFHHDCTDDLLALISQNNHKTLRVLDLSFSQNVTDLSICHLVKCTNLQELDLIGTSLSYKAQYLKDCLLLENILLLEKTPFYQKNAIFIRKTPFYEKNTPIFRKTY